MPRKRDKRIVCPRCGSAVSWFERQVKGDRTYVLAAHYAEGRARKCYLGPEDGYVYVTRTHIREGLEFRGMQDPERLAIYLEVILNAVERAELSKGELKKLAGLLKNALNKIEGRLRGLHVRNTS